MSKIYIFGHKKPDTDSVGGAIALSYLKNKLGYDAEAVVLSPINDESKYVIDYFNLPEPRVIDDVKLKISDLEYSRGYVINENESIISAYNEMEKVGISKIPVVDDENNLLGIVSMKDIAKSEFLDKYSSVDSTFDMIALEMKATIYNKASDDINGSVYVASFDYDTIISKDLINSSNILIVGNREDVISYAIDKKVKLLVITGGFILSDELCKKAKECNVNVIGVSENTFEVARRINLCNRVSKIMKSDKVLCINENEYLSDFINVANKTRFSYYPVLDNMGKCLGIIRYSDVSYNNKKKVILVDHNGLDQSAFGLDEAEVVEVVDHHNIASSFATNNSISFLAKPYGSVCTIIYEMFVDSGIDIPKDIAGAMLSGILSDTLIFSSPTKTDKDVEVALKLADIAGVDYQKYGYDMVKASTSIEGKSARELIMTDHKIYPAKDGIKYYICQIFMVGDDILKRTDEIEKEVNLVARECGCELGIFFTTDILKNSSFIFYSKKAEEVLKKIYNRDSISQGFVVEGLVSRKKQLVPYVQAELDS